MAISLNGGALKRFFTDKFSAPPEKRPLRLNNETGILKILACLFMLCDHMGKMIFPDVLRLSAAGRLAFLVPSISIMRAIGRLAMPIFAYGIAVGCAYSKNIWKYALRLLLVGILVQPLYQEAMGHVPLGAYGWASGFWRVNALYRYYYCSNLNIFFTLSCGVLVIALFKSKRFALLALMCAVVWALRNRIDYGHKGVILIVLFYAYLDKPLASFVSVFLFMLWWAMPRLFSEFDTYSNTQLYAIGSLAFIYLPIRKRRFKLPKWIFYTFYPAHLALIYVLQVI